MTNFCRTSRIITAICIAFFLPACGAALGGPAERLAYQREQKMKKGDDAFERGDLSTALTVYKEGTGSNPTPRDAERWYRLGLALVATNESWAMDHARQSFYLALKANRELPGPRLELARFEIEAKNFKEADKLLAREVGIQANDEASGLLADVRTHIAAEEEARLDHIREKEERRAAQDQAHRERKEAKLHQKRQLQTQTHRVGGLQCQTIDYAEIGKSFGDEMMSTTAGGTFVSVLLKCENLSSKSGSFPWTRLHLLDGEGRQFSTDWDASLQFAVSKADDEIANPEGLQLHPGVPRYIAMLFDLPPSSATDTRTVLVFGPHRFQLVFPPESPAPTSGPGF